MKTVIDVEHISKKYLISHEQKAFSHSLRSRIGNLLANSHDTNTHCLQEEFWALDDISFTIKKGQRVGIVGRNGSGKSTLLKILSRITQPTTGRAIINGRVASLLEVGTGFHHELTGRENIFLNGAILGMHHNEIRKKFDAIVAFAEIDKFLDTPVKRYSSGMYVRLAFAVAAHLEPEILIVDEVLAVGDASFQSKCLKKMRGIGERDTTILFVSHNINAVRELCDSALLLDSGKLIHHGSVDVITREYSKNITEMAFEKLSEREDRQGSGHVTFTSFITTKDNNQTSHFLAGEDIKLIITMKHHTKISASTFRIGVGISDDFGQRITCLYHEFKYSFSHMATTDTTIEFNIKKISLVPGEYQFTLLCIADEKTADLVENVARITVNHPEDKKMGVLPIDKTQGLFLLNYDAYIT